MKKKAGLILLMVSIIGSGVFSPSTARESAALKEQKDLKITRITPEGDDVPAGREVVIQFNRPVVPSGRMERDAGEIPVDFSPALTCQWRWINTSALACYLDEKDKLKDATRYTLTIKPGLRAQDGATTGEIYTHSFITQRPQIRYAWFKTWRGPGTPVLALSFNQPVSQASVEHALTLTSDKKDGTSLSYKIKAQKDPDDTTDPLFIETSGTSSTSETSPSESKKAEPGQREEGGDSSKGEEARRIWLISPEKELPPDTDIVLKVRPGLVSALGQETGVEERNVTSFATFPDFAFLGITCTKNDGKEILITEKNRESAGKCNPLGGIALSFSAPVGGQEVKKNVLFDPDLAGGRKDYDPWANREGNAHLRRPHKKDQRYHVWLPERLKAAQAYTIRTKKPDLSFFEKIKSWFFSVRASDLEDAFGRFLKEPVDLSFFTDHRPPNFELTHNTAVLEKGVDSDLPLYVTNLEKATLRYKKLTQEGEENNQVFNIEDLSNVEDIQFAVPMHIRKLLGGKTGVLYGEVETQPPVDKYPTQRLLFASVSPYQIYVKTGHYNTLVWITDLATGQPVQDANIRLYKDKITNLSSQFTPLAEGKTDASGRLLLKGTKDFDPELSLFTWCSSDNQDKCERLFVRVDKGDDMALMPLERDFEVSTYRASGYTVWPDQEKRYGHIEAWGTTAQGVYRAGGTIDYKIYVRNQDNNSYIPAPQKTYKLEIIDPLGKTVHEADNLTLSEFGSYHGTYAIPKNAAVGWYNFRLSASFTQEYTWQPMRVLVSDFTPSPFKVTTHLNGDLFQPGEEVEVSTSAKLYSGGAYTDAEARITVRLKAAYFSSHHPLAAGFDFDSYERPSQTTIFQKTAVLGKAGELKESFVLEDEPVVYGHLIAESAVRDDRGKYIAASSRADYIGVDRLVGLKQTAWLYEEDKPAEIQYIVVDPKGQPKGGTSVHLQIEHLQTKAAKVKGAGNAYLTRYSETWIPVSSCETVSTEAPQTCSFTPKDPGTYKITAKIEDTHKRVHTTTTEAWVVGQGRVVWRMPEDNSLQIIPEKASYAIGDKARYLIKNPYPGARALVSLERYGILKSWVQTLEGSTPVLEFDIEENLMPGFYLSVTTLSPRVEAPLPKMGQIDTGKPGFKTGYVKVPVQDPYKQIDVSITPDKQVYKPRETVSVSLHAAPKHAKKDEKIELAVAVLDEAVLDLIQGGETYFDPYEGFYHLEGLDIRNYSLLKQLVGRQKFEKKGANPGGDGGAELSMRTLFKYVSYWNPSLLPDDQGKASFNFEVPDNLTGWRILVLAVTPTDRMGLGSASFKVNRPTELRPVMPNQITEGDNFQAGFSVMNRTDRRRKLKVNISATGPLKKQGQCQESSQKNKAGSVSCHVSTELTLEPYQRHTVFMPVSSLHLSENRADRTESLHFTAKAFDALDGDSLQHSIPVYKRRSLDTAASYGATTQDNVTESLVFPEKIYTDIGDVSVTLSPSVIGNLEGAFNYMRDYPYTCWEQKLSKGVMAAFYEKLKAYLPSGLSWKDSAELARDVMKQARDYQAPNGGMTYFLPQDQYVSPYLSAYTALAFSWLKKSGYDIPQTVESQLHTYLEGLLRQDVVPTFYTDGMSATVRAVALAALAEQGKLSFSDIERYRPHVNRMSLFGKALYLEAALKVKGAEALAKEVTDMLLAHASQSGGKISFNEDLDEGYTRILSTPMRAQCSILSAFTHYDTRETGENPVKDLSVKLARTITQTRGKRDHWENTQDNVFCMQALTAYVRRDEQVKPNMEVSVSLDQEKLGTARFNDVRDDAVTLRHPITREDPGTQHTITLSRQGKGRLYYTTRLSYAPLEDAASRVNAGIDLRKEYSVKRGEAWVLIDKESQIKRGDLVRVDLYVSLPTERNFVVVDDPVPGGLEPVNRDLSTSSDVDTDQTDTSPAEGSWWFTFKDWQNFGESRWSFYHKELRHKSVRFYADYLPAGRYHLVYTAQAIAEGHFTGLPVHAEEMYDPDVFGKGITQTLNIGE